MRRICFGVLLALLLVACGINEERYADYDIIDLSNPFDERAVIEEGIEAQRELLKPGFLPDQDALQTGFILSNYAMTYHPGTGELTHKVKYSHKMSDASMTFEAEKNSPNNRYEETVAGFESKKPFEDHTGYYGYVEENGKKEYSYAIREGDTSYFFKRGWWDEGFFDDAFLHLLGKSLRTEADGAYSYFYDDFDFSLDSLHFPQMRQDAVEDFKVTIRNLGYTGEEHANAIYLRYGLTDGAKISFIVEGMDTTILMGNLTEKDQVETENGTSVTIYDMDNREGTYYTWEKDDVYYTVLDHEEETSLSRADIHAIIDSSVDDARTFADEDVFDQQVEEPTLTETDEKILEKIEEIAGEGEEP